MTAAAILALGFAGNVMEPEWSPNMYQSPEQFADVTPWEPESAPGPTGGFTVEQVTVDVADTSLGGLVYVPDSDGPHPGLVFIHGAGTKDATGFAEQAEHLAQAGIVSLVFDKREEGYSTWRRDYEMIADDALAAVALLRDRPDVSPAQVGLFGESEGTWIAPVASMKDPDIAFMIMVSAPIVPPSHQATYATLMSFDGLDVPNPVNRAVAKGIGLAMSVPNLLEYADFDVLPAIAQTHQPMLMVFGTEDTAVPIIQAAELTMAAREGVAASDQDLTIRYFDGAQHGIRYDTDSGPFASGYLDSLAGWITDTVDGGYAGPAIAGGQPSQTLAAGGIPDPPWYATAYAHLAVLVFAIAGYLAGPVAAGHIRRRDARRNDDDQRVPFPDDADLSMLPARRRSLRWVRFFGVASLVALVVYFIGLSHLALNHLTSPVITYGGWALVWLITAGAVTALVSLRLSDAWRGGLGSIGISTSGRGAVQLNTLERIALVGAVGGTVLLLMVVTYWGVFLGI